MLTNVFALCLARGHVSTVPHFFPEQRSLPTTTNKSGLLKDCRISIPFKFVTPEPASSVGLYRSVMRPLSARAVLYISTLLRFW